MCQNYCFSNGNVWIWELDQKEVWAPKNWCFWIIVLEKTLESPLDSKDIKWVNSEGNKPWIFIGSSVQFSRSVVSDSLRPHESQHTRPPCLSPTPGVYWDSRPWVSDVIQPSHPLSSPSPPDPNPSQNQSLFQWVNSSHEVAKVLEFQF